MSVSWRKNSGYDRGAASTSEAVAGDLLNQDKKPRVPARISSPQRNLFAEERYGEA